MRNDAFYFTTRDGVWFQPTELTRGPWDADACHAGPPIALVVRALERLIPHHRFARLSVDLIRPIPMAGFTVEVEVERAGRSMTLASARILDDEKVFARASALHLRTIEDFEVATAPTDTPKFEDAVPGPFPITDTLHDEVAFPASIEVRYDPSGSQGAGGPTTVWMRSVPFLAGEEPSGMQRLCPLADSGNGISYNQYLDRVLFVNPDLHLSVHREPVGEWIGASVLSHWQSDGTGLSDAEMFDESGPVGRAVQSLILNPAG